MTAFAPELAMSKMHRTVKEIKEARKERKREGENERGGMEQPRFSLCREEICPAAKWQ